MEPLSGADYRAGIARLSANNAALFAKKNPGNNARVRENNGYCTANTKSS